MRIAVVACVCLFLMELAIIVAFENYDKRRLEQQRLYWSLYLEEKQ